MSEGGLKSLIGKPQTKTYDFMGEKITVKKLTVEEVMNIQDSVSRKDDEDVTETEAFASLRNVIRMSCPAFDELDDGDFNQLPLDDLTKLSQEIMRWSGISGGK
jgi:hypothetical protein